jgi:alkyl hydroperoxide reductase subunit D
MTLAQIADALPDYAKDLRVNLQNVMNQTELTPQQTWSVAVSCALACRNETLSKAVLTEASPRLTFEAFNAAKAAMAIMGMNNIFYRFRHMIGREEYNSIPGRLRMQVIRGHGGDPLDFELCCLAVSAINGCEACVKSHEAVLREKGLKEDAILASIRIAATLHAVAGVVEAEA